MDTVERQALTMLCAELVALREECARLPVERQRLLAQIESEARARRPIVGLLSQLLGVDRGMLAGGLPGFSSGRAYEEEPFSCPDRACDRVCARLPAGPVPRCLLTGVPMEQR